MFRSTEGMTKLVGKYGGVEGPLVEVPDGEDGDAAVVEHWVLVADAHLFRSALQGVRAGLLHEQDPQVHLMLRRCRQLENCLLEGKCLSQNILHRELLVLLLSALST